jgi:hypothetical protein
MSRVRRNGLAIAVTATISLAAPAQAGFFDQFFGTQPQAQPQPYYGYGFGEWRPAVRHRSHRVKAAAEEKIIRQTPTDLMHDATLRYGDAVMTKTGISIFTGERKALHDLDDFSPLKAAKHLRPGEKIALEAVDAACPGSAASRKLSSKLISGRSSASVSPVAEGPVSRDQGGKPIRYVGP